jgi:hypothetical protein
MRLELEYLEPFAIIPFVLTSLDLMHGLCPKSLLATNDGVEVFCVKAC